MTPLFYFIILAPIAVAIYGFRTKNHGRAFTVFGISFIAMILLNHYIISALFSPFYVIIHGLSNP